MHQCLTISIFWRQDPLPFRFFQKILLFKYCRNAKSELIFFFVPEILHRFRHPSKTYGALRPSRDDWNSVSHLETGDVTAVRKLHHVAHPHEHYSAHAQGFFRFHFCNAEIEKEDSKLLLQTYFVSKYVN